MANNANTFSYDISDIVSCLTVFDNLSDKDQLYIYRSIPTFSEKYKEWFGEDLVLNKPDVEYAPFQSMSKTYVNGNFTNPYISWAGAAPIGGLEHYVDENDDYTSISVILEQSGHQEEQLDMEINESVTHGEVETEVNTRQQNTIKPVEEEKKQEFASEETSSSSVGTCSDPSLSQIETRVPKRKTVLPLDSGKKTRWSPLPNGGREKGEGEKDEGEKKKGEVKSASGEVKETLTEETELKIGPHDIESRSFLVFCGKVKSRVYYDKETLISEDAGLLVEKGALRVVVYAGSTAKAVAQKVIEAVTNGKIKLSDAIALTKDRVDMNQQSTAI